MLVRGLSGDHDPVSSAPTLPPQVSPPEFAVTATRPHALAGVDVIALPVLAGRGRRRAAARPGRRRGRRAARASTCSRCSRRTRATGKAGEVTALPVPLGAPENAELRQVLLVGVGAASADDFRRAGAALARAVRDRTAVATTIPAVEPAVGLEPFVVGAILGSFAFHWRSAPPEHVPVARVVLAGLADDDRPRARAGGGDRRRRAGGPATLASVPSNLKNPRLARRPGRRAGRRGRPRGHGLGREAAGRRGVRRHPRRRPGLGDPAAADPARLHAAARSSARARRPWCWSARASPSTPAASRSSPARRWST